MKRISDKRQKKLEKYYKQAEQDDAVQRCASCGEMGSKKHMHKHHTKRRLGKNLYEYEMLCPECHRLIEEREIDGHIEIDNDEEKRMHNLKPGDNMLR